MDEKTLHCLAVHFKCLYEDAANKREADPARPCLICNYFNGDLSCNHHHNVMMELEKLGITVDVRLRNTKDSANL